MGRFEGIQDNEFRSINIIAELSRRTGLSIKEIQDVLRYNIITPKAFSLLAKKDIHTIENLRRPRNVGGDYVPVLTSVYPFKLGADKGPAFILIDESAMSYLMKNKIL